MNEQMKTILQQQQEYEFIKQSSSVQHLRDTDFYNTIITNVLVPYIEKEYREKKRKKLFYKIAKIFFYVIVAYFIYAFIVTLCIIPLLLNQ